MMVEASNFHKLKHFYPNLTKAQKEKNDNFLIY